MLGKLSANEIEELLTQQAIGRIGCHANGVTYVVPINYVYKDGYIYGHSAEGKKIKMLRHNPQLCFQVDDIENMTNWKSVIAWGVFQQITDREEMQKAMQDIIHHVMPLITDPNGQPSHGITENESDIGSGVDLILYRIYLDKKTGKFEHS